MEDIPAPSFSLGFDLDFDSETESPATEEDEESIGRQAPTISISRSVKNDDEEEKFNPKTLIEDRLEEPIPVFKRLKRGLQVLSSYSTKNKEVDLPSWSLDEEIEEFSSQEDEPSQVESLSVPHRLLCNSSKFSLHGQKVLTTQSAQPKSRKNMSLSSPSISTNLELNKNKQIFPRLTINPLRKFQFDSDSDEPSTTEDLCQNAKETNAPGTVTGSEKKKANASGKNKIDTSQSGMRSEEKNTNASGKEKVNLTQSVTGSDLTQSVTGSEKQRKMLSTSTLPDLWKNFISKTRVNVHTPALDDFCEEYFRSVSDNNVNQRNMNNIPLHNSKGHHRKNTISEIGQQYHDLHNPLPSAHYYFYHEDPRIKKLVRDRLPNFVPLGVADNMADINSKEAIVDYRSQFGQSSSQFHATRTIGFEGTLNRDKRNLESINVTNVPQASRKVEELKSRNLVSTQVSQDWVNPKNCTNIPKDAGKRRIQADGHSIGHWFTGQDGRKAYISKNGQELSGQIAYRQYKKDSGAGFKRLKKKAMPMKK